MTDAQGVNESVEGPEFTLAEVGYDPQTQSFNPEFYKKDTEQTVNTAYKHEDHHIPHKYESDHHKAPESIGHYHEPAKMVHLEELTPTPRFEANIGANPKELDKFRELATNNPALVNNFGRKTKESDWNGYVSSLSASLPPTTNKAIEQAITPAPGGFFQTLKDYRNSADSMLGDAILSTGEAVKSAANATINFRNKVDQKINDFILGTEPTEEDSKNSTEFEGLSDVGSTMWQSAYTAMKQGAKDFDILQETEIHDPLTGTTKTLKQVNPTNLAIAIGTITAGIGFASTLLAGGSTAVGAAKTAAAMGLNTTTKLYAFKDSLFALYNKYVEPVAEYGDQNVMKSITALKNLMNGSGTFSQIQTEMLNLSNFYAEQYNNLKHQQNQDLFGFTRPLPIFEAYREPTFKQQHDAFTAAHARYNLAKNPQASLYMKGRAGAKYKYKYVYEPKKRNLLHILGKKIKF